MTRPLPQPPHPQAQKKPSTSSSTVFEMWQCSFTCCGSLNVRRLNTASDSLLVFSHLYHLIRSGSSIFAILAFNASIADTVQLSSSSPPDDHGAHCKEKWIRPPARSPARPLVRSSIKLFVIMVCVRSDDHAFIHIAMHAWLRRTTAFRHTQICVAVKPNVHSYIGALHQAKLWLHQGTLELHQGTVGLHQGTLELHHGSADSIK